MAIQISIYFLNSLINDFVINKHFKHQPVWRNNLRMLYLIHSGYGMGYNYKTGQRHLTYWAKNISGKTSNIQLE